MTKNPETILFATDANYVPHLATAIYSLLVSNQDVDLKIMIFTGGIPKEDQEKIENIGCKFNVRINFKLLDDQYFDGLILNHHFQRSNYYRLLAADIIKEERCLYLDADIVVTDSVRNLFDVDINDYYLAAVENPGFTRHAELGMHPKSKYFNSGVMLINLAKWRENRLKDAVISLVRERPEAIRFVDQCGLNGVVDGNWLELDTIYNCQSSMLAGETSSYSLKSKKPVIVHFTGSDKPWHMNNKNPYKRLYWQNRNRTPYRSMLPEDFNMVNLLRYLTPDVVKSGVRRLIRSGVKQPIQ